MWCRRLTLGETRTQETRDLLDQGVGGDESIVLAGELLDQLLVLVELLQVVGGHGVNTVVLGPVDIVLVTEDTTHQSKCISQCYCCKVILTYQPLEICNHIPDAHSRAGDPGKFDSSGETLVTLRIIVLEADLQLDGLEEVSLLLVEGVVE